MASNSNSLDNFISQFTRDLREENEFKEAARQSQEVERQNFAKAFQDLAHRTILKIFEKIKRHATKDFRVEIPDTAKLPGDPATLRVTVIRGTEEHSQQLKFRPTHKSKGVEVSNGKAPDGYSLVGCIDLEEITEEYVSDQIQNMIHKIEEDYR